MTALLLLALQAGTAREWVEKLRSEKVEERDDAVRRLKEIGRPAAPELEKAAKDPDPEVAGRARKLLNLFAVRERLTPRLCAAMPGIEDRLGDGNDRTWAEILFELGDRDHQPGLLGEDLEPLLGPAFRAASEDLELLEAIFGVCIDRRLSAAAPEIARFLKHADAAVREQTVLTLRSVGPQAIAPNLVPLLRDPNERVRERAWELVTQLRAPETAAPLLELLKSSKEERGQILALWALGNLKSRAAIPFVLPLLRAESEDLRANAVRTLGELGAREETGRIAGFLGDQSFHVREAAVEALRRLGAREAVPELRRLLREEKIGKEHAVGLFVETDAREAIPEIRALLAKKCEGGCSDVVDALREFGVREAAAEVARHLPHWDGQHRFHVPSALKAFAAKEAVPELVTHLGHSEEDVRCAAADLLGFLRAETAVPALAALLGEKETSTARDVVNALGRIGTDEAIAVLRRQLESEREKSWPLWIALTRFDPDFGPRLLKLAKEEKHRQTAALMGGSLRDAALLPAFVELLRDMDPDARRSGIQGIALRGAREAFPQVLRLVADKKEWTDHAHALFLMQAKEAIPQLLEGLKDPRPEIRGEVADALGRLGAKEAAPVLRELLSQGDVGFRSCALRSLVELGAREAIPDLIDRVRDPVPYIRGEAMEALSILNVREAVPHLLPRLKDQDGRVAGRAALALARLGAKEAVPELERLFWVSGDNAFHLKLDKQQPEFALALAALGSTFGVDYMLEVEDGIMPGFFTMNALRSPDSWKRLTSGTIAFSSGDTVREVLDRLGREAGLPIRLEGSGFPQDPEERLYYRAAFTRGTVADHLAALFSNTFLDFIVEADHIRILPATSARLFWLRWWREQGKKR